MGKRRPLPPAATKCGCGHAFFEHVQGGEQHACQHGAQPPFTNMCPCKKFRTKEEELAHAEMKRNSRRERRKKKTAAPPETPSAPAVSLQATPEATALAADLSPEPAGEKPNE